MLLLFRNRGGGGLPPDNGFGLLSLTTTKSGVFQALTATKTGAPLRWWWGDGTFSDGNNPSKVYPDATEKTIYVATTDGWSGLTDFRCIALNISAVDVSVATALTELRLNINQLTTPPDVSANTALTHLYLDNNQLTTAPDVSANTALTQLRLDSNQLTTAPDVSANTALTQLRLDSNQLTTAPDVSANTALALLYLHGNQLTTVPDVSANTALTLLYLHGNQLTTAPDVSANTALAQLRLDSNQLTTAPDVSANTALTQLRLNDNQLTTVPDVSANTALTELRLNTNQLPQAQLDALIDQCWQNRVSLGGNSCDIQIQSNADPPGATAIAQIDGTGIYAGDGLIDNGCSVTY